MTTGTYLDKILPQTREDLDVRMSAQPLKEVKARVRDLEETRDFVGALSEDRLHLIAEVKRASPSKGDLAPDIDAADLARVYIENGASAISVLTDMPFFKGSLDDLKAVRDVSAESGTPILRKDFVIDEYMIYEARLWGADAILLLVVGLSDAQLEDYQGMANELGMAALIETHDEFELYRALEFKPRLIGINNRDLRTFVTDLSTAHGLAPRIGLSSRVVAESGISTIDDARSMRAAGADAILVGEALITAEDTPSKTGELSSLRIPRLTGMETNVPSDAIEQSIPGFGGGFPGLGGGMPGMGGGLPGGIPGIGGFGEPRFPGFPGGSGPGDS